MCGILITYGIDESNVLSALNDINNRGPFNRGKAYINGVGIGMVQLPMKSQCVDVLPIKYKSYYVSYNGEVYDEYAKNIEKEIEIIMDSVCKLKPINGMFAIAAYDVEKNKIILARDEFGIKPIYYYYSKVDKIFIACSEIGPIIKLIGNVKFNPYAISEIVAFGTQAGEETCFSGIYLLEPGSIFSIYLDTMEIIRDTLPEFQPEFKDLDSALQQSISSCISDTFRPSSLLISDGLDSNLLLTYLDKDINKYNVILNDLDLGVNLSQYTKLKQTSLNRKNFNDYFIGAVSAYGQPCRMTSILMYQSLSEYIGQDGTHLVITGEGADEIFWGYPRHLKLNDRLLSNFDVVEWFFNDLGSNLLLLKSNEQKEHIYNVCNKIRSTIKDPFDSIFYMDKKFSLEPLLRRSDHLMMRNTIETRVPFLHFGIPSFAKKIGIDRIKKGHNKSNLIELMATRNSQYKIKPKTHFRAPVEMWFLEESSTRHYFSAKQCDILEHLGISIDNLMTLSDKVMFEKIFMLKTMVVWYENFERCFV